MWSEQLVYIVALRPYVHSALARNITEPFGPDMVFGGRAIVIRKINPH